MISAMVTVLLMARPMPFSVTATCPFSYECQVTFSVYAVRIVHCRNMVRCDRFAKCSHGTRLVPLGERLCMLCSYELGLRP